MQSDKSKDNQAVFSYSSQNIQRVTLQSEAGRGLGFDVGDKSPDGFLIQQVNAEGAAGASGQLQVGDKLSGLCIGLDGLDVDDVREILQFLAPYPVKLKINKAGNSALISGSSFETQGLNTDVAGQVAVPGFNLSGPNVTLNTRTNNRTNYQDANVLYAPANLGFEVKSAKEDLDVTGKTFGDKVRDFFAPLSGHEDKNIKGDVNVGEEITAVNQSHAGSSDTKDLNTNSNLGLEVNTVIEDVPNVEVDVSEKPFGDKVRDFFAQLSITDDKKVKGDVSVEGEFSDLNQLTSPVQENSQSFVNANISSENTDSDVKISEENSAIERLLDKLKPKLHFRKSDTFTVSDASSDAGNDRGITTNVLNRDADLGLEAKSTTDDISNVEVDVHEKTLGDKMRELFAPVSIHDDKKIKDGVNADGRNTTFNQSDTLSPKGVSTSRNLEINSRNENVPNIEADIQEKTFGDKVRDFFVPQSSHDDRKVEADVNVDSGGTDLNQATLRAEQENSQGRIKSGSSPSSKDNDNKLTADNSDQESWFDKLKPKMNFRKSDTYATSDTSPISGNVHMDDRESASRNVTMLDIEPSHSDEQSKDADDWKLIKTKHSSTDRHINASSQLDRQSDAEATRSPDSKVNDKDGKNDLDLVDKIIYLLIGNERKKDESKIVSDDTDLAARQSVHPKVEQSGTKSPTELGEEAIDNQRQPIHSDNSNIDDTVTDQKTDIKIQESKPKSGFDIKLPTLSFGRKNETSGLKVSSPKNDAEMSLPSNVSSVDAGNSTIDIEVKESKLKSVFDIQLPTFEFVKNSKNSDQDMSPPNGYADESVSSKVSSKVADKSTTAFEVKESKPKSECDIKLPTFGFGKRNENSELRVISPNEGKDVSLHSYVSSIDNVEASKVHSGLSVILQEHHVHLLPEQTVYVDEKFGGHAVSKDESEVKQSGTIYGIEELPYLEISQQNTQNADRILGTEPSHGIKLPHVECFPDNLQSAGTPDRSDLEATDAEPKQKIDTAAPTVDYQSNFGSKKELINLNEEPNVNLVVSQPSVVTDFDEKVDGSEVTIHESKRTKYFGNDESYTGYETQGYRAEFHTELPKFEDSEQQPKLYMPSTDVDIKNVHIDAYTDLTNKNVGVDSRRTNCDSTINAVNLDIEKNVTESQDEVVDELSYFELDRKHRNVGEEGSGSYHIKSSDSRERNTDAALGGDVHGTEQDLNSPAVSDIHFPTPQFDIRKEYSDWDAQMPQNEAIALQSTVSDVTFEKARSDAKVNTVHGSNFETPPDETLSRNRDWSEDHKTDLNANQYYSGAESSTSTSYIQLDGDLEQSNNDNIEKKYSEPYSKRSSKEFLIKSPNFGVLNKNQNEITIVDISEFKSDIDSKTQKWNLDFSVPEPSLDTDAEGNVQSYEISVDGPKIEKYFATISPETTFDGSRRRTEMKTILTKFPGEEEESDSEIDIPRFNAGNVPPDEFKGTADPFFDIQCSGTDRQTTAKAAHQDSSDANVHVTRPTSGKSVEEFSTFETGHENAMIHSALHSQTKDSYYDIKRQGIYSYSSDMNTTSSSSYSGNYADRKESKQEHGFDTQLPVGGHDIKSETIEIGTTGLNVNKTADDNDAIWRSTVDNILSEQNIDATEYRQNVDTSKSGDRFNINITQTKVGSKEHRNSVNLSNSSFGKEFSNIQSQILETPNIKLSVTKPKLGCRLQLPTYELDSIHSEEQPGFSPHEHQSHTLTDDKSVSKPRALPKGTFSTNYGARLDKSGPTAVTTFSVSDPVTTDYSPQKPKQVIAVGSSVQHESLASTSIPLPTGPTSEDKNYSGIKVSKFQVQLNPVNDKEKKILKARLGEGLKINPATAAVVKSGGEILEGSADVKSTRAASRSASTTLQTTVDEGLKANLTTATIAGGQAEQSTGTDDSKSPKSSHSNIRTRRSKTKSYSLDH